MQEKKSCRIICQNYIFGELLNKIFSVIFKNFKYKNLQSHYFVNALIRFYVNK